ncbi:MAG: cytidine deaminase [Gemmatimonadales bacterium]|nr:cytidine deaminase [Gemmatimonadales bacterium]MDG2238928.1 cytidine deaminase [Longimicrobiales bacterium]NCG32760.1 cytidine deaminase [Pseudomonadota bacterium]MBT3499046.1 cytidine deaminase [Gemmatimonadales bacterium]MBT3774190.1 cytidine deaminase [Gemmatimonadales bacterium]
MNDDRLVAEARAVMGNAYAPYSEFHVGAALLGQDGSVYVACNVENGSYGLTVCAERAAVGNAVAAGVRNYVAVAIVTDGDGPVGPCGACRQVLAEFAPTMRVISEAGGRRREWTLDELLPEPFDGLLGRPGGIED